eukprot:TRINITY_DN2886_c0_g2_i1.p1 TRINITY_DN2886_c0_g2~~TRINITY_DN2886_c0_g2_i1.p1  ORF type:complete len:818 (-),score=190.86 TRINITY_DN2886_c0_g2_i1:222-2675(-)
MNSSPLSSSPPGNGCVEKCNIQALISSLQAEFQKPAADQDVTSIFSSFQFNTNEWRSYQHYSQERYVRNLVTLNDNFSLLLICWEQGQSTPIHEHGDANTCWVRVVEGQVTLELFNKEDEAPKKTATLTKNECHHFEALGLHRSSNKGSTRAMSLHLYSPPYLNCCFKSSSCNTASSAPDAKSFIPVVYCASKSRREELKNNFRFQHQIFTNFQNFVEVLKQELEVHADDIPYMCQVIGKFNFNPKEWRKYIHFEKARYTRNLVGYDQKFTLLLLCWDKGQASPIHDHAGSSCWVKMLEGELVETRYDASDPTDLKVVKRTVMPQDSVAYIHDTIGVHKMENESTETPAVSLHIYAPAYVECNTFDIVNKTTKKISMKCANVPCRMEDSLSSDFVEMKIKTCEEKPKLVEVEDVISRISNEFGTSKTPNISRIQELIDSIDFQSEKWAKFIHFNEHRWTRSLIAFDENFSLMLNCWNRKQGTPVHHHGNDGTVSWTKVVMGEMKLTSYKKKGKRTSSSSSLSSSGNSLSNSFSTSCSLNSSWLEEELDVTDVKPLTAGTPAIYMDGTEGLHKTENASCEVPAISLHLYSPPYLECRSHSEDASGGEKFPVVYCNPTQYRFGPRKNSVDLQLQLSDAIYENFNTLTEVLKEEFGNPTAPPCPNKIKLIMKSFQLNPKEWGQYVTFDEGHYTRSLVSTDDSNFSLILIAWTEGQQSPIHDHHHSRTWIKVLEGELEETTYVNLNSQNSQRGLLKVLETNPLATDAVIYRDHNCIHKNESKAPKAVTLHLYSPPCLECCSYNLATGEKRRIPVESIFKAF